MHQKQSKISGIALLEFQKKLRPKYLTTNHFFSFYLCPKRNTYRGPPVATAANYQSRSQPAKWAENVHAASDAYTLVGPVQGLSRD